MPKFIVSIKTKEQGKTKSYTESQSRKRGSEHTRMACNQQDVAPVLYICCRWKDHRVTKIQSSGILEWENLG